MWVDFDPVGPLMPVGIGHYEDVPEYAEVGDALLGFHRSKRWSFAGNIIYTAVTMSALERDRLLDEIVACIAFGEDDIQRGEFRSCFEHDPLIALNVNWDTIDQRGHAASPGTPWGTDEMMYEGSVALQVIGEFVGAPGQTLLVPISSWSLYTWVNKVEQDPVPEGDWIS